MHEHFPIRSYLGWAFNAVLELWIIRIWWRNRKRFRLTVLFPVFVIFLLATDVICFIALKVYPGTFAYWHSYWWPQLGKSALRALLAIRYGRKAFRVQGKDSALEHVPRVLPDRDFCSWIAHRNDRCDIADNRHLGSPVRNCSRSRRVLALPLVARCQRLQRAVLRPSVFHVLRDIALFLVMFKTGLVYLPYIRAALPLTGIVTLVLFVVAAALSTKPDGSLTTRSTTA